MFDKLSKLIKPITYISAFILAITWAVFVHYQQYGSINLLKNINTKVVYDVPVLNDLQSSKYTISKLPSVADVEISGTKYELEHSDLAKDFQLYIPNQKLNQGKNTIEIKVKNYSNTLQVNVLNKFVAVDVDSIQNKTVPAFLHYINLNNLDKKKIIKTNPNVFSIKFSGPKKDIDNITSAELIVDSSVLNVGNNKVNPTIIAIDSSGNKISNVTTLDRILVNINVKKE